MSLTAPRSAAEIAQLREQMHGVRSIIAGGLAPSNTLAPSQELAPSSGTRHDISVQIFGQGTSTVVYRATCTCRWSLDDYNAMNVYDRAEMHLLQSRDGNP